MLNRFRDDAVIGFSDLDLRVYTSRLLGEVADLVLHGGGNTSLKVDDVLYVKGSGWDLATITEDGFSPVKLSTLIELANLDSLSDSDMVNYQKKALIKDAPNPSIEAIVHAILPYKFIDHTHSDAIVTITNTPKAKEILFELFGETIIIVDYVKPGFDLAKAIQKVIKDVNLEKVEAIILLNHGVFTFSNSAKDSYSKMVDIVTKAEKYLQNYEPKLLDFEFKSCDESKIKEAILEIYGTDYLFETLQNSLIQAFSNLKNLKESLELGTLTPEHVIRIKRKPLITTIDTIKQDLNNYIQDYKDYFFRNKKDEIMLEPFPKWIVIRDCGAVFVGKSEKEIKIIKDIALHNAKAILIANSISNWKALDEKEMFAIEYWELEQMKLKAK